MIFCTSLYFKTHLLFHIVSVRPVLSQSVPVYEETHLFRRYFLMSVYSVIQLNMLFKYLIAVERCSKILLGKMQKSCSLLRFGSYRHRMQISMASVQSRTRLSRCWMAWSSGRGRFSVSRRQMTAA